MTADAILQDFTHYFGRMLGRRTIQVDSPFLYQAVVYAARDRLMERWNQTRNLTATTGWGGISYTGPRVAAPFAILDTIYEAVNFVAATDPNADFPPLDAFWSPDNKAASPTDVDMITDPILDKIIGAGLRGDVFGSAARPQAEAALDALVTDLLATCGGTDQPACDDAYTRGMVKGLCTAAVSSGPVHIH